MSESFSVTPLQDVIPAYIYQQYSDDENIQAFATAYNQVARGYLEWFNTTPLAIYVSSSEYGTGMSAPLLDWCATGIYGIPRPFLSSIKTAFLAGLNSTAINTRDLNGNIYLQSGTSTPASDDVYKRVLTWWLYLGDGHIFSVPWLRRRVARFLYGTNGGDINFDDVQNVRIAAQPLNPPPGPTLSYVAGGALAATTYYVQTIYVTPEGTTLPSPQEAIAVPANSLLVVSSPPAVAGATGWNVGVSTTPTAETIQNTTPIAIGTNFTEPTSGLISGAAMPTTNTSNPVANIIVTVPSGTSSQYFQQCVANNVLSLPFQLTFTIVVA